MRRIGLAWQILIALALGIIVGAVLHNFGGETRTWAIANVLAPAGQIFIKLIKMIVLPIVLSSLVVGIAGVGDAKKLGKIGAKTLIYFEVVTTVAIVIGVLFANLAQPGAGIDMHQLATTGHLLVRGDHRGGAEEAARADGDDPRSDSVERVRRARGR